MEQKTIIISNQMVEEYSNCVTKALTEISEQKTKKFAICITLDDGNTEIVQNNCDMRDFNLYELAMRDEAIIRVIGVNKDRVERFQDEDEGKVEEEFI